MEFKEYLAIFGRQRKIFFLTLAALSVLGVLSYHLQPQVLDASFALNVTRKGMEQTSDYRYDQFYRLQADERFADTLVRWLQMPGMLEKIAAKADFGRLRAARLSSQLIRVDFEAANKEDASLAASAVCEQLSIQTAELDVEQRDPNWFKISCAEVSVRDGRVGFWRIMGGALFLGVFGGFWMALLKHYLEK